MQGAAKETADGAVAEIARDLLVDFRELTVRINPALHIAALTQIRMGAEGATYNDKLIAAGKTRKEALRLLRRRLTDRVYAAQRSDLAPVTQTPEGGAPLEEQSAIEHPASSMMLMAA